MRFAGFIGPSYTLRSVNVDAQRSVNLYPELNELGTGKAGEVAALIGTPGLEKLFEGTDEGPIRLIHVDADNRIFFASGNLMHSATFDGTDWTVGTYGTLTTSTGPMRAASAKIIDGEVVSSATVFVDGETNYLFLQSDGFPGGFFGTFADFAYPGVPTATHVVYIDGYFIFNEADTGLFYVSDLGGLAVDPLSFASSEGDPDFIVGMISNTRDLWIFNERTTEVFINTGNADFPFERVQGGFIEKGCASGFTIAKIDSVIFWLGRDEFGQGVVYAAQGLNPQRVSTHAVEFAISTYADINSATAYTYQDSGHSFYVLNFAENTWVYDLTSKSWHERCFTNEGALERHRGEVHCFIPQYGLHLVGDYANNSVYRFNNNYYYDDESEITRLRTSPHITDELRQVRCLSFQLDMETGVGNDGGLPGSDPQVVMQFSDDGGHTFSSEAWASAGQATGQIGQYKKRVIWRRLGTFRDRIFRVKITDPVKVVLIGAELELDGGFN